LDGSFEQETVIKKIAIFLLFFLPAISMAKDRFKQIAQFDIPDAKQGIAVDRDYFYAIDDRAIAKYRKQDGKLVNRWEDRAGGHFIHLNSAVVVDGKLYAAHSDWPYLPPTSSVEIWNAKTMAHIQSHPFDRPALGYLTWLDFHDGYWWGTFAHYGRIGGGDAYGGGTINTNLSKFDKDWNIIGSWAFPADLLKAFGTMSNSGGSWGPDGFLYLTGHDLAAVYQVKIPESGSTLELVETIPLPIRGQGIAWDRHQSNILYGIIRATAIETKRGLSNKIEVFRSVIPLKPDK
jgi:hypothetical protein